MNGNDTSWGIEPVPERLRVLGGFDLGLLWGNLGISLLVVVAGAILVPALSLPSALVAIAVGCLVGNLMLAVAGLIGAQARVPAMTLMRAPLGTRGSFLPTAINVVQCLGWTIFELLVIATAAAALSDELLGFGAQWLWTVVFGAAALAMGLLGPIGVVRTVLRRVAVWAMPLAIGYLTWWALTGGGLSDAWNRPGVGGISVWQGIDIVVGVTVSWVPLAADYTRFARSPRAAFWGTGVGYLLPDVLLLALGAVILLTREVGDAASLPAAVAAGGLVALLALLVLTVAETDEAFANAYSGAVSLQNLFPGAPQRLLIVATTSVGVIGALTLELTSFQSFLFLLGSFFVPLFAVLLADWLLSGLRYDADDVFEAPSWRRGCSSHGWSDLARTNFSPRPGRSGGWTRCSGSTRPPGASAPRCRASSPRSRSGSPRRRSRAACDRSRRLSDAGRRDHRQPRARRRRRGGGAAGRRSLVRGAGARPDRSGRRRRARLSLGPRDRDAVMPSLQGFGFPVHWRPAERTTRFSFDYDGDRRVMEIGELAEPWSPADIDGWVAEAIGDASWVIVGALTRIDFPLETLAALTARGHQLILDAQGLVRHGRLGPLESDGSIDRRMLGHITALKLNDEEAEELCGGTDEAALRTLGIPEVVLTLGSDGALIVSGDVVTRVDAVPVDGPVDPTGAGDSFLLAYLHARQGGAEPHEAGESASRFVSTIIAR